MHDLSPELVALRAAAPQAAVAQAERLERREVFSVHRELLVAMYASVAVLVAGIGLLLKQHFHDIGPGTLLTCLLVASLACHAVAWRARHLGRERSLGEDYVLLLGALLFSAAVGYAELRFRLFGAGWSRHFLLLAIWHLAVAYVFRSRLVLAVALTALAAWLGVELRLGSAIEPRHSWFGLGPRALLCALFYYAGSFFHHRGRTGIGGPDTAFHDGFREVYRQFAAHFAFWGTLAMIGDETTRWLGAAVLVVLSVIVGRIGLAERRESYVLYAVGYGTIGLVWLESALLRDRTLTSLVGLVTVIGAVALLMKLRSRLKASTA